MPRDDRWLRALAVLALALALVVLAATPQWALGAPAPPPPLIETDGCAAYRCANAASVELVDDLNGRRLRVRYCHTHGAERRLELAGGQA